MQLVNRVREKGAEVFTYVPVSRLHEFEDEFYVSEPELSLCYPSNVCQLNNLHFKELTGFMNEIEQKQFRIFINKNELNAQKRKQLMQIFDMLKNTFKVFVSPYDEWLDVRILPKILTIKDQ